MGTEAPKLSALRVQGVLSDDEFATKKAERLGRLEPHEGLAAVKGLPFIRDQSNS